MAGIAVVLDLLRKKPSLYTGQSLHSYGLLTATAAASAAAAAVSAGTPFASRALFGISVAHCDAGAAFSEDFISSIRSATANIFQHDSLKYRVKEYKIVLKPLFSAFKLRAFAMTSLRSFFMFYLPLLEPQSTTEEEDDEFLQDTQGESHVDLVIPFKKSIKQIICEMLPNLLCASLKDRCLHWFTSSVLAEQLSEVKAKFGHFLGVAASWLVQVGIEIYRYFCASIVEEENDDLDKAERVKVLGKRFASATVWCSSSLVFASTGAGLVPPSYVLQLASGSAALLGIWLCPLSYQFTSRKFST